MAESPGPRRGGRRPGPGSWRAERLGRAGGAEQKRGCRGGGWSSDKAESPTPRGPARLRQRRGEAAGAAR